MKEKWTGNLIGRMHNEEITYDQLGEEMGIGKSYVSQILNGARTPKNIRERMESALEAIIQKRKEQAQCQK